MISIVVVNYDGGEEFVSILRRNLGGAFPADTEVVVVDNASSDGSPGRIRAAAPSVRLVEAGENRGYAAGVNEGLRAARGDVLVILNPDVLPEPGAVDLLADAVEEHPDVLLFGGAVVDGKGRIDPCCARPLPALSDIVREGMFLPKRRDPGTAEVLRGGPGIVRVGAVSGAVMALSRVALDRLGPMDEEYFLYDEDLEWCERSHRRGGGVATVPAARFVHRQGTTTRRDEGRPFTARMLADFQFFVESRGVAAEAVRRRWRFRQRFRRWLYAADARFGILGRRPGSADRARLYGELARALATMRWAPSPGRQNAHPDRLGELTGVPVPSMGGRR